MELSCKLKLAEAAIEGIRLLNNEINEEITRKLIVNAVKQILIYGPALPIRSDVYDTDVKIEVKKADFGVCSVLTIASQHGLDSLQEILDHYKINEKTSKQLLESYEKFKDELTNRLSRIGNSHNIPFVTDIDYEIQQHTTPPGDLVFKLTLKGFDHEKNENTIIEEIFCNQEELQLLISKLKDIERHCEKISKVE